VDVFKRHTGDVYKDSVWKRLERYIS
jgi:hypothetical protein